MNRVNSANEVNSMIVRKRSYDTAGDDLKKGHVTLIEFDVKQMILYYLEKCILESGETILYDTDDHLIWKRKFHRRPSNVNQ